MSAKLNESGGLLARLRAGGRQKIAHPGPIAAVVACYLVAFFSAALVIGVGRFGALSSGRVLELGQVSDKDVVATRTISYVDVEATQQRVEELQRAVPPVFLFDGAIFSRSSALWRDFTEAFKKQAPEPTASREMARAFAQSFRLPSNRYPSAEALESLTRLSDRDGILEKLGFVLSTLESEGVLPEGAAGTVGFRENGIEILRSGGSHAEHERVSVSRTVSMTDFERRVEEILSLSSVNELPKDLAVALISPFLEPTLVFSREQSDARLKEVSAQVEPVMVKVSRGERIIRKGFMVTQKDLERLAALGTGVGKRNTLPFLGTALLLGLGFLFAVFLGGEKIHGRPMDDAKVYLLCVFAAAYLLSSSLLARFGPSQMDFPISVFLPTALLSMLMTVLTGVRSAVALSLLLPYGAFVIGAFDANALIFAASAGAAGAVAVQGAERRMDLIRAGAFTAVVQTLVVAASLFASRAEGASFPSALFWSAFNGFICGVAVLGFLPVLEQAMNAPTVFRLVELSDLNAPPLKRLLTAAPGTYSHSVMVANLAESACREIGANALLARVGGYYHDIGKIDQPDYFIENQAAYNKHDDIQPRLSATVIKSHVKVGIEKARRLRLPKEVVDIVAEHHGNSVIAWFYNEAMKKEDQVNADDFSYPGMPPRSKESAIVMLADTVEAAARTLKKPTMSRLEKFVWELIMAKFEQGQLSQSDLTFRDLEVIKNSFVRALAGHYHSRIEYPKAKEAVR